MKLVEKKYLVESMKDLIGYKILDVHEDGDMGMVLRVHVSKDKKKMNVYMLNPYVKLSQMDLREHAKVKKPLVGLS